jgi:hypothetical protein
VKGQTLKMNVCCAGIPADLGGSVPTDAETVALLAQGQAVLGGSRTRLPRLRRGSVIELLN